MKLIIVAVFSMFLNNAFALSEANVSSGTLICSVTSPKTLGFELIKVGAKDRVYTGSFDIEDLKFEGSYQSKTADLDLTISAMDDDGVVVEEVFFTKTNLFSQNFLHIKTKQADRKIELYCYFTAN